MSKQYPDYIYESVRQRWGYDEHDDSCDADIDALDKTEVLNIVASWDGLIDYGPTILEWVNDIYGLDLE